MSGFPEEESTPHEGTRIYWAWVDARTNDLYGESTFCPDWSWSLQDEDRITLHFEEFTAAVPYSRWLIDDEAARIEEPPAEPGALLARLEDVVDALGIANLSPERQQEAAFSSRFREALEAGAVETVHWWINRQATSTNGPRRQFETLEDELRDRRDRLSVDPTSSKYSGPLFFYKRELESESDILELQAPVNVTWETALGATGIPIHTRMETNGWRGYYNHSRATRYAIVRGEGSTVRLRPHGAEAAKRNSPVPAKQWHVRLVEIPDAMDANHDTAGNAHHDPRDHGVVSGRLRSTNWAFKQAREEVTEDWHAWGYAYESRDIGTGDYFTSSHGILDIIQPI